MTSQEPTRVLVPSTDRRIHRHESHRTRCTLQWARTAAIVAVAWQLVSPPTIGYAQSPLSTLLQEREKQPLPTGSLDIAYRQRIDGKLEDTIHVMSLSCEAPAGLCTVASVTLNHCIAGGFYPKLEVHSELNGDFTVQRRGQNSLTLVFDYGATMQVSYTTRDSQFDSLTGFSGAVVKESAILRRVISWDLVPVTINDYELKSFACPMTMPFVEPRQ